MFEFDVPYIIVSDGLIIEQIALKDDNGALLVTKIIDDSKKIGNKSHVVVNRKELEKIYTNEKNKFVLHLEDEKYIGEKPLIATLNFKSFTDEKEIYNTIKCQVINGADYIRKHSQNYQSSVVEKKLIEYPQLLDYMRQMITDDDLTKLIFNVGLKGSRALILNANENNIYLKYVFARFIKSDKYIIDIIDLPVNKYNLEQLKNLQPKIFTAKEPKISLKLNPNINKEDIQKAKQKIKTFGK